MLHYVSDAPSSQYRNISIFSLLCRHEELLEEYGATWTYFESGHGKGPCDGIGAAAKRNADWAVQRKYKIKDAADFAQIGNNPNHLVNREAPRKVYYECIPREDVDNARKLIQKIKADESVEGTMVVHAAVPVVPGHSLAVRETSCFRGCCWNDGESLRGCPGWVTHELEFSSTTAEPAAARVTRSNEPPVVAQAEQTEHAARDDEQVSPGVAQAEQLERAAQAAPKKQQTAAGRKASTSAPARKQQTAAGRKASTSAPACKQQTAAGRKASTRAPACKQQTAAQDENPPVVAQAEQTEHAARDDEQVSPGVAQAEQLERAAQAAPKKQQTAAGRKASTSAPARKQQTAAGRKASTSAPACKQQTAAGRKASTRAPARKTGGGLPACSRLLLFGGSLCSALQLLRLRYTRTYLFVVPCSVLRLLRLRYNGGILILCSRLLLACWCTGGGLPTCSRLLLACWCTGGGLPTCSRLLLACWCQQTAAQDENPPVVAQAEPTEHAARDDEQVSPGVAQAEQLERAAQAAPPRALVP